MITHSKPNDIYDNILMDKDHFENGHKFQFDESHFLNQLLIKFEKWGSFSLAGRLTEEGFIFLENNLTNLEAISFEQYLARIRIT